MNFLLASVVCLFFVCVSLDAAPVDNIHFVDKNTSRCPDGWINFESSCYWYSNKYSSMRDAFFDCEKKDATLFVANTIKEWDFITTRNNKNPFNWIGLYKDYSGNDAKWQAPEGMSVYDLPLMIKRNEDLRMNGWSDTARCAASFNTVVDAGKYVYFYPCEFKFNYICERNATLYYNNGFITLKRM